MILIPLDRVPKNPLKKQLHKNVNMIYNEHDSLIPWNKITLDEYIYKSINQSIDSENFISHQWIILLYVRSIQN